MDDAEYLKAIGDSVNRVCTAFAATTSAAESSSLTIEKLGATMREIERTVPKMEIQIGTGQAASFAAAVHSIGDTRITVSGRCLCDTRGARTSLLTGGIPIVERELMPAGVGLLVETRNGITDAVLHFDWQDGRLKILKLGCAGIRFESRPYF